MIEKEETSYNLTYDSPEWNPRSKRSHDQEVIAQERLNIVKRGRSSLVTRNILEGINEASHSASKSSTFLYQAVHTVYECHYQCTGVL